MTRPIIHRYGFDLENADGLYKSYTATFCVWTGQNGTWHAPAVPTEVEWLGVIPSQIVPCMFEPEKFERWARKFTGNSEWSLKDFDNAALQIADDYDSGLREEAWEHAKDFREHVYD